MKTIEINGVQIELTDEQAAQLVEQYKAKEEDWLQAGDEYWLFDYCIGVCKGNYRDSPGDLGRKSIGNCFRTQAEAEQYREYLVALATLKRSSDFKPDWANEEQAKYGVFFETPTFYVCMEDINSAAPVYYRTEREAEAALQKYRKEFEIVYGVVK